MDRGSGIDIEASFEASFLSGGSGTTPHEDQDNPRNHRRDTHDRIQYDRVRPRNVDFEEPNVRHAVRGEVRETRDRQGDDAHDYQNQPDHDERSHSQPPVRVEQLALRTMMAKPRDEFVARDAPYYLPRLQ
jgi:hypothetical protein